MYESFFTFIQQLCPDSEIDFVLLKTTLKSRKLCRGEFLFQEGETCEFVGFTLNGCLRTFVLKNAKEYTLFFHTEQDTLGDYESFQKGCPTRFSVQAVEDSEIVVFDHQVMKFFETIPQGQTFLRRAAEDLAFLLRDKVLSLFLDTPEERYLDLLQSEPELLQRIPQYYLASYLGIEPQSLSRLKRRIHQKAAS